MTCKNSVQGTGDQIGREVNVFPIVKSAEKRNNANFFIFSFNSLTLILNSTIDCTRIKIEKFLYFCTIYKGRKMSVLLYDFVQTAAHF